MKLIRRIALALVLLGTALSAAACGGGEDVVPEGDLSAVVVSSEENDSFAYDVYSDGTVGITRYTGGYTRHTVPSEIDGRQVSRIGEKAYSNCGLVRVTIPDTVISIGEQAFSYNRQLEKVKMSANCRVIGEKAFYLCEKLKKVSIPETVEEMGGYAFTLTAWLDARQDEFLVVGRGILLKYGGNASEVTVPAGVRYISTAFAALNGPELETRRRLERVVVPEGVEIIGDFAFSQCVYLTSVELPESVTAIGKGAFAECASLPGVTLPAAVSRIEKQLFFNCESLAEYEIPDTVTSVGEKAFAGCFSLKTLRLGRAVESFPVNALEGCTALERLETAPDAVRYRADGLCLYSADGKTLEYCSPTRTDEILALPEGTREVADDAVRGNGYLKEIVLPAGVERIGQRAFMSCSRLKYIVLPESLRVVDFAAFTECGAIVERYYAGTAEQWAGVEIGRMNTAFTSAYLNYESDGTD